MAFENPNNTFQNDSHGGPITVVVPTTGQTIIMKSSANNVQDMLINSAGTLAALTIQLPDAPAGTMIDFEFTQLITALTFKDYYGNTVATAPTSVGAVNTLITMRRINNTLGWRKWY